MLVVWNGATKRQKNLFANTLTVSNIGAYTRAMTQKERGRAVNVFIRIGSTLIAKVRPWVSTTLIREDVYETNLDDIYAVVVAEELEWFLIGPLTLSRFVSTVTIMSFYKSGTHPIDSHIRVGRGVECSKRRWK